MLFVWEWDADVACYQGAPEKLRPSDSAIKLCVWDLASILLEACPTQVSDTNLFRRVWQKGLIWILLYMFLCTRFIKSSKKRFVNFLDVARD